jgi:hypothetical protein
MGVPAESALNRFRYVLLVVRSTDHLPYDAEEGTLGMAKDRCLLALARELEAYYSRSLSPQGIEAATPQPPPQPGGVEIAPLVLADIRARVEAGERKYGTKLQAHNGRDALMDAYQEAIEERTVRP